VVGRPYQYEHAKKGEQYILEDVTVTSARVLGKVAMQHCEWKEQGDIKWRGGQPKREEQALFRGVIPTGLWREETAPASPELRTEILRYVIENPGNVQRGLRDMKKELEKLQRLSQSDIPQLSQNDLNRLIERATPQDITDPEMVDVYLRRIITEENLTIDTVLAPGERERIYKNAPASVEQDGVELPLRYSNGKARSYITDLKKIEALQHEAYLPDGRHVQLMYERGSYTVDQLKSMHRR
jgi:hypothetical protein